MLAGDIINLRMSMQAIDADNITVVSQGIISFTDVENDPLITSFPVVVEKGQSIKLTFEQTAGTVRDWNWRLADVPV